MKKIKYFILSLLVVTATGCNYLDIVPDGVVEISSQFANQAGVRKALGKCYSYMPTFESLHNSTVLAGDEWSVPTLSAGFLNGNYTRGHALVRGLQNTSKPLLSYWTGGNGGTNLYEGIRYCNIFLENINAVMGVSQAMIDDWVAQVKVLRAYYHFFLIQCYGPILIYDHSLDLSSSGEEIRAPRQPLEDCFQFVIKELDEAIAMPNFQESRRTSASENLLLDKVIAKAIKAKVLMLRASKIFNGNALYTNFKNGDGELYIDAAHFEDDVWKQRWEDARTACQEAIDYAETTGRRELYKFTGTVKDWDLNNWAEGVSDIIQYCYNLRFAVVEDGDNSELIWGYGGTSAWGNYTLQTGTQIRTFTLTDAAGNFYNDDGNTASTYAFGYLGASFTMEEAYYSKNGVPIDEDKEYNYGGRMSLTTVPEDSYHHGYMSAGGRTVGLHLNREPRYYAWLMVDRGMYRDYDKLIPLISMLHGDMTAPGSCTQGGTSAHDVQQSGIGIKKFVHPESKNKLLANQVHYPFPIIRLADLYLLYAEACAELDDLETAKYYLDQVRARAGLKGVDESWANYSTSPSKPSTREGLLEIIKHERWVELSFEGHRYFDVVRWMEGDKYFTTPFQGWNYLGRTAEEFYKVVSILTKQWSNKNYLWPIPSDELNINPKLDQNPWW